ncbi:hypothetical protein N7462_000676 [Penicillium macrosclerotiorum]|uniref:uncharacterized protein n=1 Tax=Penicillium macrosclerotiorum TaxID=303699 RepID=UPI0025499526|nr:uncharacterized protein N7462_000676 [Penicillium macrosclerotiorum]KAJ5698671.1 hypothetical protein N7462_000676 [Penicillium macrosclerotiorum]
MISKLVNSIQPDLLHVYLAWVDAWLLSADEPDSSGAEATIDIDELATVLDETQAFQLTSHARLMQVVSAFKNHVVKGNIIIGGTRPPSCDEINLFSQKYNPQTECHCDKISVTLKNGKFVRETLQTTCYAIKSMEGVAERVIQRQDEWCSDLFTSEKLRDAVTELKLANREIQPVPDTCQGSNTASLIPIIQAPDRRPNPGVDGNAKISHQLYPTAEQLKICTDAKYYGVIACGAGICDEGLARAVADSSNDILIGDYCEAADEKGLKLLQQVGAAAMSFLKLCNMGGRVSDWQFNNLSAYMIQCRVLGFFRDHSRPHLPDGIYGSRMTGLGVHRHIDSAAFHGVMTASLATGHELSEMEYMKIVEACVYINDFVDFRGDILRKQRENVILRGIRGNLCKYIDRSIEKCLETVLSVLDTSELGALVVMGFCNWAILGSHHKAYELMQGVRAVKAYNSCTYRSEANVARYGQLMHALKPYGTLGNEGPHITKKRVDMEKMFSYCRNNPATHLAWLADVTRSFFEPTVLRKLVDVVHYEWSGDMGEVEYCP